MKLRREPQPILSERAVWVSLLSLAGLGGAYVVAANWDWSILLLLTLPVVWGPLLVIAAFAVWFFTLPGTGPYDKVAEDKDGKAVGGLIAGLLLGSWLFR